MRYLTIHQEYRQVLTNAGLSTPEDFLRLDSVVFCGHPGRNVARASIETQSGVLRLLIKREHSVPVKERLGNLAGGFGFASKSKREARTLTSLQAAGIPVPEWIAHGEDMTGCAFLVLRECPGAVDMLVHLSKPTTKAVRARWIARLGRELAKVHQAGFDHQDLYSKHILVQEDEAVCFIDWQRTGLQKKTIGWKARIRGLARLSATVDSVLATPRERLRCLAAYLAECRRSGSFVPDLHSCGKAIDLESARLSKRRRLRELQRAPANDKEPRLIWRDGEALCMTRELETCIGSNRPEWLALDTIPSLPAQVTIREQVEVAAVGLADLKRSRQQSWSHLLRNLACRQRPSSQELREAGFLFRLERLGLSVPRVLAFGQRSRSFGRLESFILQVRPPDNRGAREWLEETRTSDGSLTIRRQVVRQAGLLLRQLHRANFYLSPAAGEPADQVFAVVREMDGDERMMLDRADLLISRRHESLERAHRDVCKLSKTPSGKLMTRADRLRFLLAYCDSKVFGEAERAIWRRVVRRKTIQAMAGRVFGLLT